MRLGISSTLMQTDLETAQQQCTIHEENHSFFKKTLRKCIIT